MRVLIVGPLSGELGKAASIVLARGALVDHVESVDQALTRICDQGDHKLVICGIDSSISCLVAGLQRERISIPVLACGPEDPELAALAIANGAEDYIPLPPDPDLIAAFIQNATDESLTVLSSDPVMLSVVAKADRIAASDASVLITGESGTGKEVMARYIHQTSKRAKGPFVALNCAALPETLVESELFGHERGAFSGAAARRIGRFEAADGGTLLLDEISEMDVRLQAKLLRAIQEREIDRLGGSSPVPVNVRLIATSNRDLPSEVSAGRFREDLYFRLNVVSITLPPLRSRALDIAFLAHHFSRNYSEINGLPDRPLSPEALQKLEKHSWRGNVRELENAMHRAVLMAPGKIIDADAFEFSEVPDLQKVISAQEILAPWVGHRMDEVEQALILDTLSHTDGNRTHAASLLGISIRALRNKLRDYAQQGAAIPPPTHGMTASQ
ncbi:sigma-54-dependent transcriptional regulator [Acetobacter oeni]|uniref:Sigma-54-dependent Fis family transcriptional regulator n=1 Tax=Acetobacter oeni TaxID=304077 RepID=A0A511XFU8_9PROT|nr:sigma-54 dependent transcriptional regulator [Acetobacter oeni]MBB3882257.1 DNA-binding NtrC family response regulator [Acetobacter oeni]NHO18010.1 AAA domain-containing protein [Acetobacter oeni]GBR01191.1 transcriptional regulator FlbD [Acetobacter oeni LMG 21952]GEN61824.1 sigma-54-dependent Fis family transcriptional regulator [Acetobacter oeni]